ncbi:hypothetical protein INR49_020482 [Caranx melampygus]|nr:hypothetical protein INR49_020482 [Caranx melampygus]
MSSREVKEYLSHHLVPQLLERPAETWTTRNNIYDNTAGSNNTPHFTPCVPVGPHITPHNPPTNHSIHSCPTDIFHTCCSSTPSFLWTTQNEQSPPPHSTWTCRSSASRPPPPLVQTELSIESDSDMTESSGLLQEVSILHPRRSRPLIIFIIGGPGSGKRSQTARLVHCFGLRAISLGDLLRKKLLSHASPSRKWEVISEMMSHGELGPQIGSPDLVMLLLCSNETLSCRLQQRASRLGLLGDSSHTLRRRLDTFQRDVVSVRRYYSQTHLLTQIQLVSQNAPVKSMMFNIRSDQL